MVSRALLSLILCLAFLGASCNVTRKEIEAYAWLNNTPLPPELCEREPTLKRYGFYRRLNDGHLEFITFCNPLARDWVAISKRDMKNLLDAYLPEPDRKGN